AGFDFDEDQHFPIAGDDVDLADARSVVALEDFVSLVAEELGGDVFAALTERIGSLRRAENRAEFFEPLDHERKRIARKRDRKGSLKMPTSNIQHRTSNVE